MRLIILLFSLLLITDKIVCQDTLMFSRIKLVDEDGDIVNLRNVLNHQAITFVTIETPTGLISDRENDGYQKNYRNYRDWGFEITSIKLLKTPENQLIKKQNKLPWPVLFDENATIPGQLGISSFPSSLAFNKHMIFARNISSMDLEIMLHKTLVIPNYNRLQLEPE